MGVAVEQDERAEGGDALLLVSLAAILEAADLQALADDDRALHGGVVLAERLAEDRDGLAWRNVVGRRLLPSDGGDAPERDEGDRPGTEDRCQREMEAVRFRLETVLRDSGQRFVDQEVVSECGGSRKPQARSGRSECWRRHP